MRRRAGAGDRPREPLLSQACAHVPRGCSRGSVHAEGSRAGMLPRPPCLHSASHVRPSQRLTHNATHFLLGISTSQGSPPPLSLLALLWGGKRSCCAHPRTRLPVHLLWEDTSHPPASAPRGPPGAVQGCRRVLCAVASRAPRRLLCSLPSRTPGSHLRGLPAAGVRPLPPSPPPGGRQGLHGAAPPSPASRRASAREVPLCPCTHPLALPSSSARTPFLNKVQCSHHRRQSARPGGALPRRSPRNPVQSVERQAPGSLCPCRST